MTIWKYRFYISVNHELICYSIVFCVYLVTVDERCFRFSDCASCTANTNGCQWCDDKKCISASSNCSSVSGPTGGARALLIFHPLPKIVSTQLLLFHEAQAQIRVTAPSVTFIQNLNKDFVFVRESEEKNPKSVQFPDDLFT